MTVSYPDVSNYNGPMPLQAGTVACFAKSSEGTGFRDVQYAHFKAEAARVGALFGAYHFLLAGNGAAQARFAFSIVGPGVPMMIDFEPSGSSLPTVADAVVFRDTYRSLGGLCTVNYLPRWYWLQLGSPHLAPLADLALVASGYTAYSDTAAQWEPYGGVSPAIWQWTDAQPYSGQHVDFNAYRGTLDQLRAVLGLAHSAPVPASPPKPKEHEMLLLTGMNNLDVWLKDGLEYHHVTDGPSVVGYQGAGVQTATVTPADHAAILANIAAFQAAVKSAVSLTDAQVAALGAAIAAGIHLPTTITLAGTETVTETGTIK